MALFLGNKLVIFPKTSKDPSLCYVSERALPITSTLPHLALIHLSISIVDLTCPFYPLVDQLPSEVESFGVVNYCVAFPETVDEAAFVSDAIFPDVDALTMR